MTIVRSLVTKLGFKVDKTGLANFEKSILGIKAKISIAAAALGVFANKIVNTFDELSKSVANTDFFSKSINLTTKELVALQKTAEQFGIDEKAFQPALKNLSKGLYNAERGFGLVYELQRKSQGKLNLFEFVQNKDAKQALAAVLDYINDLETIAQKEEVIKDVFGDISSARGIIELSKLGGQEYLRLSESNISLGENVENFVEDANKLQLSITKLSQAFNDLYISASQVIAGPLLTVIDYVTDFISGISSFFKSVKKIGFVETINKNVPESQNPINSWEELFEKGKEAFNNFFSANDAYKNMSMTPSYNNSPISISNNIQITVPPSTTEEQGNTLGQIITETILDTFFERKVRQVINDNPQVE